MTYQNLRHDIVPLIVSTLVLATLTACVPQSPPPTPVSISPSISATFPDEPICLVFSAAQLSPILNNAPYEYGTLSGSVQNQLHYTESNHSLIGRCYLQTEDNPYSGILSVIASRAYDTDHLTSNCNGPRLELTSPKYGEIEGSASCDLNDTIIEDGSAWVKLWGGGYDNLGIKQLTTISVDIDSRPGRDGIKDATQIIQMILDFMDDSYLAAQSPSPVELPTEQ